MRPTGGRSGWVRRANSSRKIPRRPNKAARRCDVSALGQARHEFHEIAGPEAIVELADKYAVPSVLHRAGRSGQREDIGAPRHAGGRPRLDGGRADALIAEPAEQFPAARNLLVLHLRQRFGRGVAPRDARSARGADRKTTSLDYLN